eukprot:15453463-Alexandrium_andersonii.AAC.1
MNWRPPHSASNVRAASPSPDPSVRCLPSCSGDFAPAGSCLATRNRVRGQLTRSRARTLRPHSLPSPLAAAAKVPPSDGVRACRLRLHHPSVGPPDRGHTPLLSGARLRQRGFGVPSVVSLSLSSSMKRYKRC